MTATGPHDIAPDDVAPVVIVGAGPTGVTAALLLARYGVRCVVLERWAGAYPQPRAVHLDDEVVRILGRLGLAGAFAGISRPGLGLRVVDRQLRVLAEFRRDAASGRHGFPQANMFDQPDLENVLREALSRQPEVLLVGDREVTGLHQNADHVVVHHTDRAGAQPRTTHARFVLGCDGANSVVRRATRIPMRELGFEQRWLVVDGETASDLGHWDGVHQVCDPVRAGTYMRIGQLRHRWEFRLLAGESVAELAATGAVRDLIRPWVATLPDDELRLIRTAEYTFRAQVAQSWRDRRVFLLGDAAHLTPPFIGQGLGAGLRDADNLCWKVAGVLQGRLPSDYLDSYQRERKAHATAMIRLAVLLGTVMTGGGRVGDVLRGALLPRVRAVPGLRARVVDSATPRLRRPPRARPSLPYLTVSGALCPNARLDDGSRLDDAPAAFVVLALPDAVVPPADRRQVGAAGGIVLTVGVGSDLGRWLRRRGVRWAVVRPDGTVLAAGRRPGGALAALPGFPALSGADPGRIQA